MTLGNNRLRISAEILVLYPSLRSKRFPRAFPRFKAFFAFERAKSVALAPIFAPPKSEKCFERVEKLRKRLLRRLSIPPTAYRNLGTVCDWPLYKGIV